MAQTDKATPDWERIESDYRAGLLSVREIAAPQGITEGAVRKRAKRDAWTRDLAAKIKSKSDDLVRKEAVRNAVRIERADTDAFVVEANAEAIAAVRISHRGDIARFRRLARSLLREIEIETESLDLFEELGELLRSEDDKGQDKRNDIYRKVITGASRVDSMKKLAETLKTLIGLEREAYNIGEVMKPSDTDSASLLREIASCLPD
ncbi:MAG TPA: hypothetical protein VF800_02595 [Telluria sp.]|jgi:hypothetical protein